jgi:hypothetical protein
MLYGVWCVVGVERNQGNMVEYLKPRLDGGSLLEEEDAVQHGRKIPDMIFLSIPMTVAAQILERKSPRLLAVQGRRAGKASQEDKRLYLTLVGANVEMLLDGIS